MAQAPKTLIDAVDKLRCERCEMTKKPPQSSKIHPPKPYIFNHEVGIDVFDLHNYDGTTHLFLNIECQGTNLHMCVHVAQQDGTPSSKLCAEAFMFSWTQLAGWPKLVTMDKGLHYRGKFPGCLERTGSVSEMLPWKPRTTR